MTFAQWMAFPISALSLAITALMIVMVVWFVEYLNRLERIGCGLIGGSSFLIIPPLLDFGHLGTPFDLWPSLLFRLGIVFFAAGWLQRKHQHNIDNWQAKRQAKRHLKARGKL